MAIDLKRKADRISTKSRPAFPHTPMAAFPEFSYRCPIPWSELKGDERGKLVFMHSPEKGPNEAESDRTAPSVTPPAAQESRH